MKLRIYRQYDWINTSDMIGGKPQWSLTHYDTLQRFTRLGVSVDDGEWTDVDVVEGERPERPDLAELQKTSDKFKEWIEENKDLITQRLEEAKK